ncbi:unnamed protein product [Nippostrongylus brasiliensis]|uniref:Nucleotid_trans domain-containing protein n=1 Tax=Nippostrongylus brasiliensis TaxID=27835 RepID=A0A158QZY4_NIPBR|nr:unnamed protein product [Nippostrongylus brasiliensis]
MNSSSNLYKTALDSMKCYAYQNDYKFIMVNNTAYHKICPQRDFFFQRHCIVAHLLAESNYSWILLVDTDIGVVNENRTIEEYIRDDADIIFYDRFFNFEVMAGSYLVKKSEYGIKFLRGWANFESRLPKVFSGSDNGAIHGKGWARDAWLSNSHWSPVNDFMFHALKEKYRKEITEGEKKTLRSAPHFPWMHTLHTPLDLEKCRKKVLPNNEDSKEAQTRSPPLDDNPV